MKILFIGDIIGKPGRRALKALLPNLLRDEKVDFVIANGENAAGGTGLTPETADEIFSAGCDIITSGNHIWKEKALIEKWDIYPYIIRGANYPPGARGKGSCIKSARNGLKIGVINLEGRLFMHNIDCPFRAADREIEEMRGKADIICVDFHAEATSEKKALAYYIAGRVAALVGTHTHVQTADEQILTGGTAYITDLGMTGPLDSVIGARKEVAIERFLTGMKQSFQAAKGKSALCGAIVEIDEKNKRAVAITRVFREYAAE